MVKKENTMREIIFRGYSTAFQKWVYGDLLHFQDGSIVIANEQQYI